MYAAARTRLRPIMMTTAAALCGAIPLAIGTGDGAELRQPLGISVLGGLVLSQVLTLYTTPVVYVGIDRLRIAAGRFAAHMAARMAAMRPRARPRVPEPGAAEKPHAL